MPLDAICLSAVRAELEEQIIGTRAEKIRQPERDILILTLRGAEKPVNLLISAGIGDARIHITQRKYENPQSPPMFCMLLRKHLTGARIIGLTQPPQERVLEIRLKAQDMLGDILEKTLIVELMGRYTNIILTDGEGLIIDCLRRIGGGLDDKRRVLPGLRYIPPEKQEGKISPVCVAENVWQINANTAAGTADKWLLEHFSGLSPLICRELSWRAYGDTQYPMECICDGGAGLRLELKKLEENIKTGKFTPCLITDEKNTPREFSYTRILQYGSAYNITEKESFSELLEEYFTRSSQQTRIGQKAAAMTKTVKNARERLRRKLEAQRVEIERTRERDYLRECGELITANYHVCEKGMGELIVQDFYADGDAVRKIKLDPMKTPQQNAAKYFKDYTKAKNAEKYLTEQIKYGENELKYLESVLEEITLCEGEGVLAEIRDELSRTGYLKSRTKNEQKKTKAVSPMRFISSSGREIYAGRSNTQNDTLTLKSASKSDIWLHAKGFHGAHVVISCSGGAPDEQTLTEAAVIAAWYSKARESSKVPVDYCYVKNVKKPAGGRPGAVIYTEYKTIFASPDETLVKRIQIV